MDKGIEKVCLVIIFCFRIEEETVMYNVNRHLNDFHFDDLNFESKLLQILKILTDNYVFHVLMSIYDNSNQ